MNDYMLLTICKDYAELSMIESVLFKLEFKNNPGLEPFYILVNKEKFYYNIHNKFGKYYIVAE